MTKQPTLKPNKGLPVRTASPDGRASLMLNDFFCGCGGIAAGFKEAGFRIAGAWDFDKYAVETYRANIGDHVKLMDITQMTADDVPRADVWAFGFPCQDLSIAGRRSQIEVRCSKCDSVWKYSIDSPHCPKCSNTKFKAANRSGLFFEVMRLLDETKPANLPAVLLAENVKALKQHLPVIEAEYKKRGYRTYYTLYNSKYWGVPQNRERYFVVGIHESIQGDFVFPEEQHEFVPKLSSVLEKSVDEKYYVADEKAHKIIIAAMNRLADFSAARNTAAICKVSGLLNPDNTARTLRIGGHGSLDKKHNYQHVLLKNIIADDTFGYDKEVRLYPETAPTLRNSSKKIKVIEEVKQEQTCLLDEEAA